MSDYRIFLESKSHLGDLKGFKPLWVPNYLFDFQKDLIDWSVRMGVSAIFADCGLGKTIMQLVWAQNIVEKTNKNVLILTPLAVGAQTKSESDKFGIEAHQSRDGSIAGKITIANYEILNHFDPSNFVGMVCDESSILKNFNGVRKREITSFIRKMPYRLLCTATAAPNDYIELGTSSEALGKMGFMDMLQRFFINNQSNCALKSKYRRWGDHMPQWRFKHHAEEPFWRWVCSWARALRKPSDLGYNDDGFILPKLIEREHTLQITRHCDGYLFPPPALTLQEQRKERRDTIKERCELAAELGNTNAPVILWCNLNDEGDLLETLVKDGAQVKGSDSLSKKEEIFKLFTNGNLRALITKPKIGGFGMNWQHCSHILTFPTHSYEMYYQSVRRCWRFGQKKTVNVDIVSSSGEINVLKNLKRKSSKADKMFNSLIKYMNMATNHDIDVGKIDKVEMPKWIK